jgi:hypothetical protein
MPVGTSEPSFRTTGRATRTSAGSSDRTMLRPTALLDSRPEMSEERRLLIGSYFTCEYSLESAALFNPSMVQHPDQTGLGAGVTRFIMSVRACGEGHISSIEFRTGVIDREHRLVFDPVTRFAVTARPEEDKAARRNEA